MLKRYITLLVSITGVMLVCGVIIYYPLAHFEPTYRADKRISQSMLASSKNGRVGYFRLGNLPFKVPREYINYNSNQADGETDALSLSFFLPYMRSRTLMEEALFHVMDRSDALIFLNRLQIDVFICPKSSDITRWSNQYQDFEFTLFQLVLISLHGFEDCLATNQQEKESVQSLKNGQYDTTLDLVAYKSAIKPAEKEMDVDTLYLKPNKDPSNPGEWIYCHKHRCCLNRSYNGLWVITYFQRKLLSGHAEICAKVEKQLNTFIKR